MNIDKRDLSYLWDMSSAAREILEFMQGVKQHEFENNKQLRYAIERQLLVIGEAANHVSTEFRENNPEIPWNQIIGQRNIIAHEYGEILVERVWLTAQKSIPELLKLLDRIMPESDI